MGIRGVEFDTISTVLTGGAIFVMGDVEIGNGYETGTRQAGGAQALLAARDGLPGGRSVQGVCLGVLSGPVAARPRGSRPGMQDFLGHIAAFYSGHDRKVPPVRLWKRCGSTWLQPREAAKLALLVAFLLAYSDWQRRLHRVKRPTSTVRQATDR